MKLYAFTTPDIPKNAGYLKIGETNGSVEKRVEQEGHELNVEHKIVWQDAVLTDRSYIDKRIHRYLAEQGFPIQHFTKSGKDTELVKCTVADLEKAFEIVKQQIYDEEKQREEVGNKFYLEIRNWFYWTAKTGDDPHAVAEPEYTLRLIVRLMLCFFLQEKELVPQELFREHWLHEHLKENEGYRYYNAIIRNLFFHCLNTPMKDRNDFEYLNLIKNKSKVKEQFQKIPFLNGGLFHEHKGDDFQLDNYHFFAEKHQEQIVELGGTYEVEGIVRILSKYQYKLSLDDLIDYAEYANTIDPEFIGKVFESLLACVDADSKESRRKVTGSFYTPREIVGYMVNESLDAYLKNNNDLLNCKILDPACGSGAFPCGVMNEMMRRFDPDKKLSQAERYHKKLDILRNVIYGVDIQPMAVQIAILRLFLSLIQDIQPDKKKDNFGIEPLPNLETKFVCANTLIGLKQDKQRRLELPIIKSTTAMLLDTRNQHFLASSVLEKTRLREYDEKLRHSLSIALEDAGDLSHETALRLAQWNPYDQTKSAEFFDPVWMFGVEKFDVVIGNPPYRQLQKNSGILAKQFEKCGYETFTKGGDIYCLFYERAWQLLPDNGICCFITSNKWMRAGYGEKLRNFLAKKTNPKLLLDFDGVKVFESATVDTSVLLYRKEPNKGKCIAISPKDEESDTSKSKLPFGIFVDTQTVNFNTSDAWVILSPYERRIKEKIEHIGKPLKDWDITILRGILTGYNEAFIIDGETKDKLIEEDAKSAAIIKPLLRGRDIKRYGYDFAEQWLIATFPSLNINIDDYPAVKKHLLSFGRKRLEQSGKKGSRKKTAHRWFEIQDSIQYYKEFEREKIVYRDITQRLSFSIAEAGVYFNNTVYFIVPKQHIKYCLAVLNSSLIDWYYRTLSVQLGKSAVRLFNIYVENIPIPIPDSATERLFTALVERRLNSEDVDTEIDMLVYKLYGLTAEEIGIVEDRNV